MMKNHLKKAAAALLTLAFSAAIAAAAPANAASSTAANDVNAYGQLRVSGVNLVSSKGKPVQLKGMSTHGMQWFPQFASSGAFKTLKQRGANLVRLAMYTGENGYLSNPGVKAYVYKAADAAIAQRLYVIIDWHILSDGNPQTNKAKAIAFFREASKKYANNPAVLYEICNEPNGAVTWQRDIKPYAQQVIPVIRKNSPHAVIIIGTPTWSQDVDVAAQSPLHFSNILYACHFYAGTHGQALRDKIDTARRLGAAIFVSEWGVSQASGTGGVYTASATQWLRFMKARKISWANWSLCDKAETSAALKSGASPNGGWTDKDLSASGKFVFSWFKK